MQAGKYSQMVVFAVLFILLSVSFSSVIENNEKQEINLENYSNTIGRSQITWSGVIELSNSFTINVTEELVISPCTVVKMSPNIRIYVEGRITAQGTTNCPVIFSQLNSGLHNGIQFNSSSIGRGSLIDNITIEDSVYGITAYGSNPRINNITIITTIITLTFLKLNIFFQILSTLYGLLK